MLSKIQGGSKLFVEISWGDGKYDRKPILQKERMSTSVRMCK